MPEKEEATQQVSTEVEKKPEDINLDKKPNSITFSKKKFFVIIFAISVIILIGLFLAYILGGLNEKNKNNLAQLEKKENSQEKEEQGVKTAETNEDVTVKSGITLNLEEARYDQTYEKQKKESKIYYEKNASQSAYLDSDYFKNSQLNLKISLNNLTNKAVSYSPSSFRLKDSDDIQYVANYEGEKQVYGLNPAEKTKLNLSYIVPTNEKMFRIIYENAVIEFTLK